MIGFRNYRVIFFCPDTHIVSDGRTPYITGIGGGISARVRIARALSRMGHEIVMVTNCRKQDVIDGVEYVPLQACERIQGDVLVASTSGGELDLRPMLGLEIDVALRIVWVHGVMKPRGLDEIGFDHVFCVSNFIAEVVRSQWVVPTGTLFVVYNSFEEDIFIQAERLNPIRDPYRLIYFSHPSKGLDSAISVLELLRRKQPRFHLAVFGGHALWGEEQAGYPSARGVIHRGLIGQQELAVELLKSTFSINLQSREEPGALAILDAQRAGCIVIGSPVGCYSEMVDDGRVGYLITGDHRTEDVRIEAASIILKISRDRKWEECLRTNAQLIPWNSDKAARVWSGYWDWLFRGKRMPGKNLDSSGNSQCVLCHGDLLILEDGAHCLCCGQFYK